jgi:hypothetical protein
MIRYSSYAGSNYPKTANEHGYRLGTLEAEYRELQELRERVKQAEAAAKSTKLARRGAHWATPKSHGRLCDGAATRVSKDY